MTKPSNVLPVNFQSKEKEEVADLVPISGGNAPGNNWLKDLPQGTTFLYAPKSRNPQAGGMDFGVSRALVVYQFGAETMLFDNLNQEVYYIVRNQRFSNAMELLKILELPTVEENQEQPDAGSNAE